MVQGATTPATARQQGKFGEQIAVDFLAGQGYAIRERNWTIRPYEVDIIAQDGDTLVFVEVKMRSNSFRPEQVVNRRKQVFIMRAARAYTARYNPHLKIRFDIIFISGSPLSYKINHIKNAFCPKIKSY